MKCPQSVTHNPPYWLHKDSITANMVEQLETNAGASVS